MAASHPPPFSRGHSGQNVRNSESVLNLRQRWQSYKQKFIPRYFAPDPIFGTFRLNPPPQFRPYTSGNAAEHSSIRCSVARVLTE